MSTDLERLASLIDRGGVMVLSGAGLSTESGIPDYRGPSGALRRHQPMTYQSFTKDERARHRYWARSYIGWPQIAQARPNEGHRAVARLQSQGLIAAIVTQNVDGLHQAGGAYDVLELHGGLDRTVCLHCGDHESRAEIERRLRQVNAAFDADRALRARAVMNPDGDADLADDELDAFTMIDCAVCGQGPLKPDVVFFGETVPRDRVDAAFSAVEQARSLLVLGSSLTVMSGFRFVLRAAELGVPVAVVNQGATRGDSRAELRIDAPLGPTLSALAAGSAANIG